MSTTPREHQERTQLYGWDWRRAERTNRAERLTRDATENDMIKDACIKLIKKEDYLSRNVTIFLPRIQREEINPTFKHPENWDHLSFQEKANLIIANKAVKLMELQCRGSVIGHQESKNITNHGSGFPDKKPSTLGGEPNTDVGIPLIQPTTSNEEDNYRIRYDEYQLQSAFCLSPRDKEPSYLGGRPNTDVGPSLVP